MSARRAAPRLIATRLVATVAALVLAGAACTSKQPATVATTLPPTRPAPDVTGKPVTSTTNLTPVEQRSQPWWKPVTTAGGQGATTTPTFTIEPNALQWRVVWHCQSAPFSILGTNEAGEPLKRPLVDTATCPPDGGKAFSSQTGRFSLKVAATGTWDAVVEEQVDIPLVEGPTAAMASPQANVVLRGAVYNIDKVGRGTVRIFQLPDGSRALRLEDFYVSINSDLEIRLSPLTTPKSTDEAAGAPYKTVAPLKATVGSMNYPVPPDIDLTQYHSVVIWCELTHNAYAGASLAG